MTLRTTRPERTPTSDAMTSPGPRWFLLGLLAASELAVGLGVAAQPCALPCVGPARGAIIAAGGGRLSPEIYARFVELAGGAEARIILIPTAGTEHGSHDGWTAAEELRRAGARHLDILHTRSDKVADLSPFASLLKDASGVWISGGQQWRLVDVYLNTETHRQLDRLLERGGVIGGNSAGASALASFLLRGGEVNREIISDERSVGFGFLRNVAVDQHLLARGRENEMFEVLRRAPHLLGIGLDEGSGVMITGDLARVLAGRVAVYDITDPESLIPLRWLDSGEVYDLGARRAILTDFAEPPAPAPAPNGVARGSS